MTENIIIVSFEPSITMALIERKNIRAVIEMAIKEAIKEAEKNHRVYKLDELLTELDDDE
jgi:hypothetical protein